MFIMKWTDEQIKFIFKLKAEGYTYPEIAEKFNKKYKDAKRTAESIRGAYRRYKDENLGDDVLISNISSAHRAKLTRARIAKENRAILNSLITSEDLVKQIEDIVKKVKFTKVKTPRPRKARSKKNMTMEVMLTDLHYGKKTENFSFDIARKKAKKMSEVVLDEIDRYSKNYNVEEVITFLGGDNIEGATIHGVESRIASEGSNSEQITQCIISLYEDYVVPVVSSGRQCSFVCITGNHDRDGKDKTMNLPGKEHFSWIIYNTLAFLCKKAGYKNVEFVIPEQVYYVRDIYGSAVLYEHGDHIKGGITRNSCESHMAKRSKQVQKLIEFGRFGHYHERVEFGRGRVIFNASFPGKDSYSDILGYSSESCQTINYYIETEDRPTPFYHSFPVYLGEER